MFNKVLTLSIISFIGFFLIPNAATQAMGIRRNQVLKHAMTLNKLVNFAQHSSDPRSLSQQQNSQLFEINRYTNKYYDAELWQTYQRLKKQTEMTPTRSAIAVYVGMQTVMGSQQRPLNQINQASENNNSAKLAKDVLIFLRKHGYLQHFSHS